MPENARWNYRTAGLLSFASAHFFGPGGRATSYLGDSAGS
jgi:hypothetical protein